MLAEIFCGRLAMGNGIIMQLQRKGDKFYVIANNFAVGWQGLRE